ncbi:MAG TPA: hypothetical protein VHS53_01285 [Mucilaginibacter sp.]|nr:hypothetical protein [Mucilaginibacter sp.]
MSITQHTNAQDFKLVGLITGATYTGSTTANQTYDASLVNGQFTTTETETVLMKTPGGKNNSLLRFDVHETVNAQGQLTANIDNFRFGCK